MLARGKGGGMGYITLDEVRDEGLSDGTFGDDKVNTQITLQSAIFDRLTGQWFEERSGTFLLDGNGGNTLFFPVPIITVTSLYLNGDFVTAYPATSYAVYNGRAAPSDDRQNPMIQLVRSSDIFAPFDDPQTPTFAAGRQNQKLIGSFGYLEADDTTPPLVKRAVLKMVIHALTNPLYRDPDAETLISSGGAGSIGPKVSEKTDRHSITFTAPRISTMRMGSLGITQDPEVEEIITMYRAPRTVEASTDVLWLHT